MSSRIALYEGYNGSPAAPNKQLSGVGGAPVALSRTFAYQSWFDDALLGGAVSAQPPGQLIIPSTSQEEQVAGYALGLHPSSETPVAVQFGAQTFTLKPGQVLRPFGGSRKPFASFRWGLPFGWLGGGTATLVVFSTPDAEVVWDGRPEVAFHRQRFKIESSFPATPAPQPWPQRFPSTAIVRTTSTTSVQQPGAPSFVVEPSRVLFRLRKTGAPLATPASVRAYFQGVEALDQAESGTVAADLSFVDLVWPSFDELSKQGTYPMLEAESGPLVRLGTEALGNGVFFVAHAADAAAIGNLYVDVVRYGRL